MIENILSGLGLETEEIKTYLLLLETGPITAGNLSKKLGFPRSSLYGFLKRLQDQGMVNESKKFDIKIFSAEAPEKISLLFKQRIEDLAEKQSLYESILPDLRKLQPSKLITPKLQIFEGEEGLKSALKDMLLYKNISTQAFWPIKKMVDILTPDFFRYLNKERIRNNLYTRAIWPKSQKLDVKQHPYLGVGERFLREIRIAPAEMDFSMGYWIYGNKAVFISSRKESFGFIIESSELIQMLLVQFELVWKISKPLIIDSKDSDKFIEEMKRY